MMKQNATPLVRRGSNWARRLLALFGWSVEFVSPPAPRCILVFYPHTSNWDFVVGIFARAAVGLRAQWVGKESLFRFPLGPLMRWLGGIPVQRGRSTGFVAQVAAELQRRRAACLALAPEGTRSHTTHWKTGFYHLALATGMPVGLAFIDYRARTVGVGRWEVMTGDLARDLAVLRAFYGGKSGKHPAQASDISFDDDALARRAS